VRRRGVRPCRHRVGDRSEDGSAKGGGGHSWTWYRAGSGDPSRRRMETSPCWPPTATRGFGWRVQVRTTAACSGMFDLPGCAEGGRRKPGGQFCRALGDGGRLRRLGRSDWAIRVTGRSGVVPRETASSEHPAG
jgi:hypothetical protein